jgi:hypothetical protein
VQGRSTFKLIRRNTGGTRADVGPSVGEPSDVEVSVVEPDDDEPTIEPAIPVELSGVQEMLRSLRGPVMIQLYRKKPTWCAGFLDEVILNEREELDLQAIKKEWGGGEIQLRPRVQTPQGTKWAKGGGVVKFTGPPRERGREIDASGYRTENPSAIMVETRPAPIKQVSSDAAPMLAMMQGVFGMMQTMMQGMMSGFQQQQQQQTRPIAPVAGPANPLTALHEALKVHKEISRAFAPAEDDDEEETPANPLERLITLGLEHLDKKQNKERGATQENPKGFRLHKANTEAPAANHRAAPRVAPVAPAPAPQAAPGFDMRAVLEYLRDLPEDKRMEVLGTLSAEIPPEVIRDWMTQNMEADAG